VQTSKHVESIQSLIHSSSNELNGHRFYTLADPSTTTTHYWTADIQLLPNVKPKTGFQ
jgi:hypothetical protein